MTRVVKNFNLYEDADRHKKVPKRICIKQKHRISDKIINNNILIDFTYKNVKKWKSCKL